MTFCQPLSRFSDQRCRARWSRPSSADRPHPRIADDLEGDSDALQGGGEPRSLQPAYPAGCRRLTRCPREVSAVGMSQFPRHNQNWLGTAGVDAFAAQQRKKIDQDDRNSEIYRWRPDGETLATLGTAFSISPERVRGICATGAREGRKPSIRPNNHPSPPLAVTGL